MGCSRSAGIAILLTVSRERANAHSTLENQKGAYATCNLSTPTPPVTALKHLGGTSSALLASPNWTSVHSKSSRWKTDIFYCCVLMDRSEHSTAAVHIWATPFRREQSKMASCVATGTTGALTWPPVAVLPKAETTWPCSR